MASAMRRKLVRLSTTILENVFRRTFLSQAYQCEEHFGKYLHHPIFEKIKPDEFYYEVEKKCSSENAANPLDIDLFCSSAYNRNMTDEMADLVHRIRRTPQTIDTLPSTHHTLIRCFIKNGLYDDLMRIVDDRVNYGIFLDSYSANLLMDKFLMEQNYTDAAKVAVQLMLQEDFYDGITPWMALFSCDAYIRSTENKPWHPGEEEKVEKGKEEEEEEEEDEDDVEYVRVPYVTKRHYFDDHFDLRDGNLLIGKTLSSLGKTIGGTLGNSYTLIGVAMFKQWENLEELISKKEPVAAEALERVKLLLDAADESRLSESLNNVTRVNLDLHQEVKQKLESVVEQQQQNDIENQMNIFTEWERTRNEELETQIEASKREERLKTLQKTKDELEKKLQLYSYFDKRDEIEHEVSKLEELKREEEKKSKGGEVEYVPPELKRINF